MLKESSKKVFNRGMIVGKKNKYDLQTHKKYISHSMNTFLLSLKI